MFIGSPTRGCVHWGVIPDWNVKIGLGKTRQKTLSWRFEIMLDRMLASWIYIFLSLLTTGQPVPLYATRTRRLLFRVILGERLVAKCGNFKADNAKPFLMVEATRNLRPEGDIDRTTTEFNYPCFRARVPAALQRSSRSMILISTMNYNRVPSWILHSERFSIPNAMWVYVRYICSSD
jgi:hypothetical protein